MTCDGKILYPSQHAALVALRFMRSRPAYTGGLNAYRCRACRGWHLGRRERVRVITRK